MQKTTQIVFVVPETGARGEGPEWTKSADAVLPWMEKWRMGADVDRSVTMNLAINCGRHWCVILRDDLGDDYFGSHMSLPASAVIALLRAHGVTVEAGG